MRIGGHARAAFAAAALAGLGSRADAAEIGLYKVDPGGRVRAVRAADVDGDGRKDLLVLVQPTGAP
jgi:hypothetical protein